LRNKELYFPQIKFIFGHDYKIPRITVHLESERKQSLKGSFKEYSTCEYIFSLVCLPWVLL